MHVPVLLNEVIKYLDIKSGGKYIDATFGMGGHSKEILKHGGKVLGIDRDPSVVEDLSLKNKDLKVVAGSFGNIESIAKENGFEKVNGILFDLGFGSHQLEVAERGFSFQKDGPLDMRYDRERENKEQETKTAGEVLNNYSEKELISVFKNYGEEKRYARRIAKEVVHRRKQSPFKTTNELFELISEAVPKKYQHKTRQIASKVFQALRIEVNQELGEVEKALPQALELLTTGGRLVVISFHSLEDRIVKSFFQNQSKDCVCPPKLPTCVCGDDNAKLRILTKKPVVPTEKEISKNKKSQSAKLRAAEKK